MTLRLHEDGTDTLQCVDCGERTSPSDGDYKPGDQCPVCFPSVSFDDLRCANITRAAKWNNGTSPGLAFAAVELAGEVGEVCNAVKKILRAQNGMKGGVSDLNNLTEELADVIICVDLLAKEFNINLAKAVRNKFNKTSDKYGFSEKL